MGSTFRLFDNLIRLLCEYRTLFLIVPGDKTCFCLEFLDGTNTFILLKISGQSTCLFNNLNKNTQVKLFTSYTRIL